MARQSFVYKSATAHLTEMTDDKHYFVGDVLAMMRRQGHGSGLMRMITEYADKHGYILVTKPQRYAKGEALDNNQLEAFYTSFGFVTDQKSGRPPFMYRQPSQKKQGI